MSWLTDLTSKAESLLNKIDQSAADKLNESGLSLDAGNSQPDARIGEISVPKEVPVITNLPSFSTPPPSIQQQQNSTKKPFSRVAEDSSIPLITKSHSADGKLPSRPDNLTDVGPKPRALRKQDDEKLFEFLNTSEGPKSLPTPSKLPPPTSSNVSMGHRSASASPIPKAAPSLESSMPPVNQIEDPRIVKSKEVPLPELNQQQEVNMISQHLQLENQLLKTEVQSLNEELSKTLGNLKVSEEETEKFKLRYENRRNQQNEDYEHIRNEYENKMGDLKEALSAKDSQLAVLRVRIQEVDTELKEKSSLLVEVQMQNEQVMKDHSDASGVQNFALDNLRDKLEESENNLKKSELENGNVKNELMTLKERMQNEQNQYAETIKQLESKHSAEKEKYRDFEIKVKNADDETAIANKELSDYKEKAARILQAKERLISSLKQGKEIDIPPMLMTEMEEVKQERDRTIEEFTEYKYKMEQMKVDFQELELLHNNDLEDHEQQVDSLQLSLQSEMSKSKHLEEDLKSTLQELQFNKDELHKVHKSQVITNQQYEENIRKLQSQLMVKQNSSSSQEELENRIHTLTDSLIHKQTVVEALSTEKNSLVLQLERLEKQYYDVQKSLDSRKKETNIGIGGDDMDRGSR